MSMGRWRGRAGASVLGVVVLLVLLAAALAGGGYWWTHRNPKVATMKVGRGDIVDAFYATGTVKPDRAYAVKSRAQGSLVQMPVREGQIVKKGDVLAQVDDKQLKFAVARNEAELKEAKSQAAENAPLHTEIMARLKEARQQLEIADAMLKRTQEMFDKNIGNSQEMDEARRAHVQWSNTISALESQEGTWRIQSMKNVEVAEANLQRAQADLEDAVVKAPIDGVVLERYVELQEVVGINQALFLLADPADKTMKAAVDEEYMTRVVKGQRVDMKLYAMDEELSGKVERWLPTSNPANKTYEVTIVFDKANEKLLVGMTAELNFRDGEEHTGLIVPSTAVMEGKVWKVKGEENYEETPVKFGVRTLDKYEVVMGLKEGDEIVVDAKQVAPIRLPEAVKPVVPVRKGDKVDGE